MAAGYFSFLQFELVNLVPNKAQISNELKENRGKKKQMLKVHKGCMEETQSGGEQCRGREQV